MFSRKMFLKTVMFAVCFIKGLNASVDNGGEVVDVTVTEGFNKRSEKTEGHVTVSFGKDGTNKYTFDLQRQPLLLSDNFEMDTRDDHGNRIPYSIDKIKLGCYYEGKIRGIEESFAGVSLCDGIRGFYNLNDSSYEIENSQDNPNPEKLQAKLTKSEDLPKFKCGMGKERKKGPLAREKNDKTNKVIGEMRGIEVFVVVDTSLFKKLGKDLDKTFDYIRVIFIRANFYYNWLNMYLVLMHVEVWISKDQIEFPASDSNGSINERFQLYKMTSVLNDYDHDVAVLMHNHRYNDTLGKAMFSSVCDLASNVLWTTHSVTSNMQMLAEVMAHEIGHTLSLPHVIDFDCSPDRKCLMHANALRTKRWADVSKAFMESWMTSSLSHCLTQQTNHAWTVCGDGVVVDGEDCDCGMIPAEMCNSKCCDDNCHFTTGSTCSTGMCCDMPTCQLKQKDKVCIEGDDECQDRIVCDGVSSQCVNTYSQAHKPCGKGEDGYCHKGKCRTLKQACKDAMGLFESEIEVANDFCYILKNQHSALHKYQQHLRGQQDAKCGVLLCFRGYYPDYDEERSSVLKTFDAGKHTCTFSNITTHKKWAALNPMYVPDGTKCGENKICNAMHCVPVLDYNVERKPVKTTIKSPLMTVTVLMSLVGMACMMYNIRSFYKSKKKRADDKMALIKSV